MSDKIIQDIENEIQHLVFEEYRKEQKVWIEARNIPHLRKLLGEARTLKRSLVGDFCRYVHDIASPQSRLSALASSLYHESR